ncbi:MAG: class I adenylate-forming enzyme family protein, partial [Rhodospirillales bacterium]|nr:class I adenylate-forming enzyme family protein [Rhodospirillales bacterium]
MSPVPIGMPPQDLAPGLPDYPTIIHALAHAARQVPDRIALICEDKSVTYAEYGRAVAGLARRLRQLSASGERVAIVMGNSIETSVAAMGGMAAGAQIALLNPGYTDHELTPLLIDCEPRILICAKPMFDRALERAGELGISHVVVLGEGGHQLDEWIHDESLELGEDLPAPDDPAAMFFTGGTTGLPKGAEHNHSMMTIFCRQIITQWALDFDTERILSVAPMFHIWGHHFVNIAPLYLRATLVIVPVYTPDIVLEQFERHAITVFAGGPPAIYIGMMGSPNIDTTDFS